MTEVRFAIRGTHRAHNSDDEEESQRRAIEGDRLVSAMRSMVMSTLLRSAVVAAAIAVGSIGHDVLRVLPWALLIVILDLVTGRLLMAGSLQGVGSSQPMTRRIQALTVTLLGAGIAGAAIASSQAAPLSAAPLSPAMLLLLVPAFRAGEVWGRLAAVAAVAISMVVAFGAAWGLGNLTTTYLTSRLLVR